MLALVLMGVHSPAGFISTVVKSSKSVISPINESFLGVRRGTGRSSHAYGATQLLGGGRLFYSEHVGACNLGPPSSLTWPLRNLCLMSVAS